MSKNVVTFKSGQSSLQVIESDISRQIVYGFLLVFFSNFVPIRLQKCCDLENQVKGPLRSFEISHFDRAHTTSY